LRFLTYSQRGRPGLAIALDGQLIGLCKDHADYPGPLAALAEAGAEALECAHQRLKRSGEPLEPAQIDFLPPLPAPSKIICVGLNYRDHTQESGYSQPPYPTFFCRVASSLIGHEQAMIRPRVSETLDFEGELVAVIGRKGRDVSLSEALDHVLGYSIFNDGSVREFQRRTSQWTLGKNFDHTGAFGPWLVTADELPRGARGLQLATRLNGQVVQSASTDEMVFDVAALIVAISEAMTLSPGDVIVTGTPSGVGQARKPPAYMRPGDVCEVEIERIGVLRNIVAAETVEPAAR
jgi:acylpyruvate hydrolase